MAQKRRFRTVVDTVVEGEASVVGTAGVVEVLGVKIRCDWVASILPVSAVVAQRVGPAALTELVEHCAATSRGNVCGLWSAASVCGLTLHKWLYEPCEAEEQGWRAGSAQVQVLGKGAHTVPDALPLDDGADVVHAHGLRAIAVREVAHDVKDWHKGVRLTVLALHPLLASRAAWVARRGVRLRADGGAIHAEGRALVVARGAGAAAARAPAVRADSARRWRWCLVTRRGDQEQQRRRQQEQQRQQHGYAALWQRGFAPAAAMKPEFRSGRFCT
jgi:hypothetical protein